MRTETLESIRTHFRDTKRQLREMLKFWLTTAGKPSLKTLTDALRNRSVGASQLAGVLDAKYCSMKDMRESKH